MSIYTTAPEVRCHACTHRFSVPSHWELKLDHELQCPECDVTLLLTDEYAVREWSWREVEGASQALGVTKEEP